MSYYNRYSLLQTNGNFIVPPKIILDKKFTDKTALYIVGQSRLDLISQIYYNSPDYGWLILLANPELPPLEEFFEEDIILRIPSPLNTTLQEYRDKVKAFNNGG